MKSVIIKVKSVVSTLRVKFGILFITSSGHTDRFVGMQCNITYMLDSRANAVDRLPPNKSSIEGSSNHTIVYLPTYVVFEKWAHRGLFLIVFKHFKSKLE